ncbi:heme NO-binding domain-containing protein [Cryomorphaceae bacterium]|nr:heme NO-binding domain-containing protein [Cryomorphaceae bacterium]
MKGIVFSEFMELVEEKFGLETVDHLIETTELASGGAYTAVGTYPHSEMVSLVVALSQKSGIPVPDLLKVFGHHLFNTFNKNYSVFFEGVEHPYDLLEKIDNHIHVEVKKLYPDAELPRFETERNGKELLMTYTSERKMSDLALGLIEAAAQHYESDISMETENLTEDGSKVLIRLTDNA